MLLISGQIQLQHVLLTLGPHLHDRLVLKLINALVQWILHELGFLQRDAFTPAALYLFVAVVDYIDVGSTHVDCLRVLADL